MAENITPIFDKLVSREEKQTLLKQQGKVLWLYGLSGSGKSTIAAALERELHQEGKLAVVLDGDNLRSGLNADLSFGAEARKENIRRAAEVAKLFASQGIIVIASFICPKRELRQQAREIIGTNDFIEIYVKASFATCQKRDPKGLYAKVNAGEIKQFTGVDSSFEEPDQNSNALILPTEELSPTQAVALLRKIGKFELSD